MEVIVRNLPNQITEKQVDNYFRPVLDKIGIKTYQSQKLRSRGCATITILDVIKARQFMMVHGQTEPGPKGFASVRQKLYHMKRAIYCIQSNKLPDQYLLMSLKKQESDRYAAQLRKPTIIPGNINSKNVPRPPRAFDMTDVMCGKWAYAGPDLVFASYSNEQRAGRIVFADRGVHIKMWPETQDAPLQQIEIPYSSVQSFTLGTRSKPSLTFSLSEAPKFFQSLDVVDRLRLVGLGRKTETFTRKRVQALSRIHETAVASCLCYRIMLIHPDDLRGVQALKAFPAIPASLSWTTSSMAKASFAAHMTVFNSALASSKHSSLPFEIKFQIQKLAQNGYISPSRTAKLLDIVANQYGTNSNVRAIATSLRHLAAQLPFPGPDTEASDLSLAKLTKMLIENQDSIMRGELYSCSEHHDHILDVHKAVVTPAGIYLSGPEPEIRNRVLRKYAHFPNHFLSVSFTDEDGELLRFDRQTSGEWIYHDRFKKVLEGVINIAGRGYEVRFS